MSPPKTCRWGAPARLDAADRKSVRGSDKGKPGDRGAGEADRYQDPRETLIDGQVTAFAPVQGSRTARAAAPG